jgi:hypothetical protein
MDRIATQHRAKWDPCNMASILEIGVLCDDQALFDEAVNYFTGRPGNSAHGPPGQQRRRAGRLLDPPGFPRPVAGVGPRPGAMPPSASR